MLKVEDFEFEPFAGRCVIKPKNQSHVIRSYVTAKISFKTFEKYGKKLRFQPTEELQIKDIQKGNFNSITSMPNNPSILACCGESQLMWFDWKKNSVVKSVNSHRFGQICTYRNWGDYDIICSGEKPVSMGEHSKGGHDYYSTSLFWGDFCEGYHAYSRNAELYGNYFVFLGSSSKSSSPCAYLVDLKSVVGKEQPKGLIGKLMNKFDSVIQPLILGSIKPT